MISSLLSFLDQVFTNLGFVLVWVMCLVGLLLSCLSISGTWLVVGATLLAMLLKGSGFPGFGSVLLMVYISICIEVVEYVAGVWGVKKRGGSNWSGLAALVGGLVGLVLGTAIPIPVLGSLLGMTAGSFGLVYGVERYRLKQAGLAAHIALGTVMARFFVVLLKVVATLGMIAWLAFGLAIR
jgi:uncharacterized protein YqgC (DUF456 family)